MESFKHTSPAENIENPHVHKMELFIDGESVGSAGVEYFSKPFPLYQITSLGIDHDKQGRGYARKLMSYIEGVLVKKGKAGILVDAIDPESPAHGMYERRGWTEVPDSGGLYVFNMPKGATLDLLKGYSFRYTDPMIRKGTDM